MSIDRSSQTPECARILPRLNVLLWRSWKPSYEFPLTFGALADHGVGGTELQMLLHARHLATTGHRVQVLGASKTDVTEEGVEFVGAADREAQMRLVRSGRVREPDVVLMEGAFDAAPVLRDVWTGCSIVHVGQNIDQGAYRAAFAMRGSVDVFAFVSIGHLADYSVRFPELRHQFMLLRNVVPWEWIYQHVQVEPVGDRVVWVGSWQKKGLRQWASAMAWVLARFPSYRWTLCGPRYDQHPSALPPEILHGLRIEPDRIAVKNLPLRALAGELSGARVVLVSLGNETASISTLDAHAMGRPVISGNDIVYKFNNPEGTGVRVTTAAECRGALAHLLSDPGLCDRMGRLGREVALQHFTEREQGRDLDALLAFLQLKPDLGRLASHPGHSGTYDRLVDVRDKIVRKYRRIGSKLTR